MPMPVPAKVESSWMNMVEVAANFNCARPATPLAMIEAGTAFAPKSGSIA